MTAPEDPAVRRLEALVGRHGRCAGSAVPDAWFPPDAGLTEQAQARAAALARTLCASCPVTTACLALALATGEEYGVWGGTAAHERAAMLHADRAAPQQLALWSATDTTGDAA
jgi:WhiB family transcriptional regulator, redox-sensing transcriptional regulator